VIQELIAAVRSMRLVATPRRAYGTASEGEPAPGQGAAGRRRSRVALQSEDRIAAFACRMVSVCGLDIGCAEMVEDLSGNLWALEVNPPYSCCYDGHGDLELALVETLERVAARRRS
jgi:hypothetical protein